MQKNRHRMIKTIGALVLAVVLAGSFGAFGPKQTMAAGGAATVALARAEGLSDNTEFSFEMYKVGHFSGPGLVLDDAVSGSNADVNFPADSEEAEDVRAKRMLDSANVLTAYIDNNKIELDAVAEFTLKPGGSRSVQVSENALYLVRSHTIRDGAEGAKHNWTPQSVYVAVLDGDSTITISNEVVTKIVRTPVTLNHQVRKEWDQNIPDGLKPEAIFVNVRYGNKIVDTVKLTEEKSWTYKWSSEEDGDTYKYIGTDDEGNAKIVEFQPEGDPKWSCDEILDAQDYTEKFEEIAYSSATPRAFSDADIAAIKKAALRFKTSEEEVTPPGEIDKDPENQAKQISLHKLTNIYSKKSLELTKKLDGYVDAGDRSNVTLAFRVIAKDKRGNELYNNVIGMAFSKDGEIDSEGRYTQTKVINDLPANTDEVTVTEVYSGQYDGDETKSNKSDDPKNKIEFDSDRNLWTVTMDNTHNYHQGSGVVNKYGDGELKGQDGKIEH